MAARQGILAALAVAAALTLAACGGSTPGGSGGGRSTAAQTTGTSSPGSAPAAAPTPPRRRRTGPFAVGLRIVTFVDRGRGRTLVTYIRYPAVGPASGTDRRNAIPDTADGPYPLVVFAPGFTLSPHTYARLLAAWARAGYVVASPVFPHTSTGVPVLDRGDLVNQPGDVRFLISSVEARAPVGGLVDRARVAVGGHSDGGDTALAVAYSGRYRDRRVRAALVFSGAAVAAFSGFAPAAHGSPPLLGVQGSADSVNPAAAMQAIYSQAPRPKYLLMLLGAEHVPPYQDEQPHLGVVERVSTAFLDRYLKGDRSAAGLIVAQGRVRGVSTLTAAP